ncbi:MAG: GDSL-type esterase/lipase family protein [Parcubacteria group bacterium]
MDKSKIIILLVAITLVFVGLWYFVIHKENKIKNYPSSGTDIVAFGDSLIEGVGASSSQSNLISVLSKKIGRPIINLGVSGNTTSDGLDRISDLDKYNPKVVILLLGGNDYLKKVPIDATFNNLEKIIKNIQDRGAVVVLLGIRGGIFNDKFESGFENLQEKYATVYVSDVLDGLFGNTQYMSDAVHPNNLGYEKIADRVYPVLSKVLR